jgi:transposase
MAHLKDFKRVLVHDCNLSYFNFGTYDNALCNAHILRELEFCCQVRGHGWALELQTVLRDLYRQAREAQSAGLSALNPQVIESSQARFLELIAQARANLPPTPSTRGCKPQSKELNLLGRLERWFDALRRFVTDLTVPFDNNLA